jgi:ATP-dependent helicase Lhr and Lhr-like helicase
MADPVPAEPFELLHAAIQHHVVNSLGWRALRPLQSATIEPILSGDHLIATAPTAGGKTEAAVLPLLSRMLAEDWRGLSVLYVCPLRALLNDLHQRLERYGQLVGRRVGRWHGDIGQPERSRLLAEPPDMLLTTPESLEAMLVSTRVPHHRWFADVRAVVVDEAHAFAGDDRGWHLLAVLERITRLAGREVQRVALSASLGNPAELLAWLTATCHRPARVINPPVEAGQPADLTLDSVGNLANAALVISRLHRGEKRLVFVDSRARAEQLAVALRGHEVTTFVSHSSLGAGERRSAEQAFAEERDCVIVSTSTLELGIDVGDLDRVIQIDAPPTVASFLQRLGRTGRRPGIARHALLLATGDEALLRTAGLLHRWAEGYVEPIIPPPAPLHLVAQQLLALSLQEGGVGRRLWAEWLGTPFALGPEAAAAAPAITDHLVGAGFVVDDGGILGVGGQAEADLGRQHFMELLSVFTSPPVFSVLHGRVEIGLVPDETLMARPTGNAAGGATVLVLAGRSWAIVHVDWGRRVVHVEPSDGPGVARWSGSAQPLGAVIARGIREVLLGSNPAGVTFSRRAGERLTQLRAEHPWVRPDATSLVIDGRGRARWWTFAGWRANLWLGRAAADLRREVAAIDDLTVGLDPGATPQQLRRVLSNATEESVDLTPWVTAEAVDGLKFSRCLPPSLATEVVTHRLADPESAARALGERLIGWHDPT